MQLREIKCPGIAGHYRQSLALCMLHLFLPLLLGQSEEEEGNHLNSTDGDYNPLPPSPQLDLFCIAEIRSENKGMKEGGN